MITSSIILIMVPLTGIRARHFKEYKKTFASSFRDVCKENVMLILQYNKQCRIKLEVKLTV